MKKIMNKKSLEYKNELSIDVLVWQDLSVFLCESSNNRRRLPSIIDTYTKPSLVPPKGIWFPANLGLVLT